MTRASVPASNDPAYLRGEQYRDARNLRARIEIHRLFSVNQQGWAPWLFDRLLEIAPPGARILELGCGAATLWRENLARLPKRWALTLSDFSAGMLRESAAAVGPRARYCVVDAQALPFPVGHFDVVVANHMLYHVPDRARALNDIRRILRPDGLLFASTVGERHLIELDDHLAALGFTGDLQGRAMSAPFTLENGEAQITSVFDSVSRQRYADELRVTDVEPLMDYVLSMRAGSVLSVEDLSRLRARFAAEIEARGCVRIFKDSGVFVARTESRG